MAGQGGGATVPERKNSLFLQKFRLSYSFLRSLFDSKPKILQKSLSRPRSRIWNSEGKKRNKVTCLPYGGAVLRAGLCAFCVVLVCWSRVRVCSGLRLCVWSCVCCLVARLWIRACVVSGYGVAVWLLLLRMIGKFVCTGFGFGICDSVCVVFGIGFVALWTFPFWKLASPLVYVFGFVL